MKLEKVKLYLSLALLLAAGFSFINLTVFLELKGMMEENTHRTAYQHFQMHLLNPEHRGDGRFIITEQAPNNYLVYTFMDPANPFRIVRVAVKEEVLNSEINIFMKRLLAGEFFVVLTLILLYQAVVEMYLKKLREKEDWIRTLMLSLTHRLGNFLAVQKVNLALLKKGVGENPSLQRMEKSLKRAHMDFGIFLNVVKEDRGAERETLSVDGMLKDILEYFEDELQGKRLFLRLKELHTSMDKNDLQDVLYNLVGNAIKHSMSKVHIKLCAKRGLLVIKNDLGLPKGESMGLGVELVRRILRRYGHEMRVSLRKNYTVFLKFKG
ncbi:MAG: sensor histidine kinase [Acidobacteria bacterium]|nr:MAG: sensor histidine kinase [Acidobacteriota bacterium]